MENRAHALAAGLFTILLSAALAAAALWFSRATVPANPYVLVANSSVSGLNLQAPVRFRGVPVGTVDTIRFDPRDPQRILIRILVDEGTPMTKGTYAQLAYQGITGVPFVQLDDDGLHPEPLLTRPDAPARIELRPSLLDKISSSGQELIIRANEIAERVNGVLNQQNRARLEQTLANVETVTGRIATIADELEPTLKMLPSLAADTSKALKHADSLFVNLNRLAEQAERRLDTFDRVARNADKLGSTGEALGDAVLADTLPKLSTLLDEFSQNSRNLNLLLQEIREQPQSLVLGKVPPPPGPGEPGFTPP